jgi:hypothetical protein
MISPSVFRYARCRLPRLEIMIRLERYRVIIGPALSLHCEAYRYMAKVELTITLTDGAQSPRSDSLDVETSYPGDLAGEHRVAHILLAELKVTVGKQTVGEK